MMTEHLGYEKHDPPEAGPGNVRIGIRTKTALTDTTGPVELDGPCDRASTSEPQIVNKRQRWRSGGLVVVRQRRLSRGDFNALRRDLLDVSVQGDDQPDH